MVLAMALDYDRLQPSMQKTVKSDKVQSDTEVVSKQVISINFS